MRLISVAEASLILAGGGFVIYPTETFLALGCNPVCESAVDAIYKIKRRSGQKPLPMLCASRGEAAAWVNLAACPRKLLDQFWPGPLSVLLPCKKDLPDCLLNQDHKLALRVSASAAAANLASRTGGLVTATSANFAGEAPCQRIQLLGAAFLEACTASGLPWGIVKQENNCHYNAPSTLVEPLQANGSWTLRLIRAGAIPRSALAAAGWSVR